MTQNEPENPTTNDAVPTETVPPAPTAPVRDDLPAVPDTGAPEQTTGDGAAATERERRAQPEASRRTRIGAAWVAVAVALIVLLALLIFILQNTKPATVRFFGAAGDFPIGVLVLLSAVGGALIVTVLGFARIIQLRWLARRDRRASPRRADQP